MTPSTDDPRARDLLLSPAFLAALTVLALNDHLLKPAFGNAVTGKLSDFAGVFAFAVFWMALLPRLRGAVCLTTGGAFGLWKTAAAQPLIDAWNALPLFDVARVVDATDMIALVVLPLAYLYRPTSPSISSAMVKRVLRPAVALSAIFLFAATSRALVTRQFDLSIEYPFLVSRAELVERIHAGSTPLGTAISSADTTPRYHVASTARGDQADVLELFIYPSCPYTVRADVRDAPGGGSILRPVSVEHRCGSSDKATEARLRAFFERHIVQPLRRTDADG